MTKRLLFGVVNAGVVHLESDRLDIATKFQMVRDSGAFDYFDITPPVDHIQEYAEASEKYGIPLTAGGFYYRLGQDEILLKNHLRACSALGTSVHNVQIITENSDMRLVTNEEIANIYIEMSEFGASCGVTPCFEVHVNMWSEHFGRVKQVADLVEAKGVKFNLTLDASHIIFKMNNPDEVMIQGMNYAIEAGSIVLDPFTKGSICQTWMDAGYVRHAHARSAVPNGPQNIWGRHPDGRAGRAIQYPFVQPGQGEWHSEWCEEKLEPWKEVFRQLFRYHAGNPSSPLTTVSTEFIPFPDYGGGAKYSLFEQNVACAEWLRKTWLEEEQAASKASAASD